MGTMRTLAPSAVAVLGVCALFIFGYVIADTGESAGPEQGVTLNDVAEHPAQYEGDRVTVSGEWAENEHFPPEHAEQVIVIGDDAGKTLLVVPRLGVDVPEIDANTVLRVTGVVRLPDRGDAGYLDPGGLLAEGDRPAPVIAAERVELPGGTSDGAPTEPDRVTVAQLLRDPRAFDDGALLVSGAATRMGDRGFVLADAGATIFVSAPRSALDRLEDGERVTVRAELARLSRYGAEALEKAMASKPGELEGVPLDTGEPYLLFRAVPSRRSASPA